MLYRLSFPCKEGKQELTAACRLVAIDSRDRRDGRPLEVRALNSCMQASLCLQQKCCLSSSRVLLLLMMMMMMMMMRGCALDAQRLGFYDPLKKETNLNAPAIKKWLEVGAQPSETVRDLLKRAMVIE